MPPPLHPPGHPSSAAPALRIQRERYHCRRKSTLANAVFATLSHASLAALTTLPPPIPAGTPLRSASRPLGSYSWLTTSKPGRPALLIPSAPPLYTPPPPERYPLTLAHDCGNMFIDQNRSRWPSSPLTPLLLAVRAGGTHVSAPALLTDRKNLRYLLSFVEGSADAFEFLAQRIGHTTLLQRSGGPAITSVAGKHKSWGHSYEDAATQKAFGDVCGFHKVAEYTLAGTVVLWVRCEVDAAITAPRVVSGAVGEVNDGVTVFRSEADGEEQVAEFVEIKTRRDGAKRATSFEAQLYFGGISRLVVAHHKGGVFAAPPKPVDTTKMLGAWEDANRGKLRMLAGVLRWVCDVVGAEDVGGRSVKVEARRVAGGGVELAVKEVGNGDLVSGELKSWLEALPRRPQERKSLGERAWEVFAKWWWGERGW